MNNVLLQKYNVLLFALPCSIADINAQFVAFGVHVTCIISHHLMAVSSLTHYTQSFLFSSDALKVHCSSLDDCNILCRFTPNTFAQYLNIVLDAGLSHF